jgi:flagellar basal-body rod modification protein FlgD
MQVDFPNVRSLEELSPNNTQTRNAEEELGKTAFLELMIAQISNQDPLEPAKNEAFIAQLAQFSSVEGIQNLNESMDSLVSSLRSSLTMDAAALVGRNVLIETNQTALNTNGGVTGTVELDQAVANLKVEIHNLGGQLVHSVDLGARPGGDTRFDWDGTTANGEQVAQDYYRVSAFADVDGVRQPFAINLPDKVVSVSIEEAGLIANLAGGTSVSASQIREIQ